MSEQEVTRTEMHAPTWHDHDDHNTAALSSPSLVTSLHGYTVSDGLTYSYGCMSYLLAAAGLLLVVSSRSNNRKHLANEACWDITVHRESRFREGPHACSAMTICSLPPINSQRWHTAPLFACIAAKHGPTKAKYLPSSWTTYGVLHALIS